MKRRRYFRIVAALYVGLPLIFGLAGDIVGARLEAPGRALDPARESNLLAALGIVVGGVLAVGIHAVWMLDQSLRGRRHAREAVSTPPNKGN